MSKFLGRQRRVTGLSMFSLDTSTGEITNLGQDVKRIDVKPGCFYRQALNRKSFMRKLIKEGAIKVEPKPKEENDEENHV